MYPTLKGTTHPPPKEKDMSVSKREIAKLREMRGQINEHPMDCAVEEWGGGIGFQAALESILRKYPEHERGHVERDIMNRL